TTVWITVAGVNDPPAMYSPWINGISTGTSADMPLDFNGEAFATSLYYDPEGDPLSIHIISGFTHGTLTTNADGTYHYVPNVSFSGWDIMTFRVSDGQLEGDDKYLYIGVSAVVVADSYATPSSTPLAVTSPGLLANDLGGPTTATLGAG